jgi:hypothetical protein
MISDYLANAFLGHMHGKASYTMPANLWICGSTTTPTNTGTNVTAIGTRVQTTAATWGTPASRSITNAAVIDLGTMVTGGTITHLVVYDAFSGGNFMFFVPLTTAKTVTSGDPVSIAIGAATTSV